VRRIAYIQYTNPAAYPPLEHSSRILADNGWWVLFLGVNMENVGALRFPPHANVVVRLLSLSRPGWRQKLHYTGYVIWVVVQTLVSRCSWVYASDRFACPPGLLLSFVPGIRVLYHEHDSPSPTGDGNTGELSRFMRLVLWTRKRLGRRAALCVLPNEKRAERFEQEIGQGARVGCVWNCPRKDEVQVRRAALNGECLWVVYHGSLVPGRLPVTVIEALSLLPQYVRLRIIGYETTGHGGYSAQLRELADKLGVASRVEFIGAVPRADSLDCCGTGDIGLAFMPTKSDDINEQAMTGASNKPFDYLACGLALLVTDLPEWRALYADNGYAVAVNPDDAHSIAAALNWLRTHPIELRAMGERGRQRILTDWNYETQFAPVVKRLNELRCKH
jgi:glycosyltransferase involved in cell wall biosynthesis